MKNIILIFLVLIIATIISCGTSYTERTPTPTTNVDYTEIPLIKIMNSAFKDDVVGKRAHLKVKFFNMNPAYFSNFLPSEYRKDYVSFAVMDIDQSSTMAGNVVIPKANSDSVFSLKSGDIIELFVYIIDIESPTGQPLLIVEKLIKSN